tara:strand:+ start:1224 stop:1553 length:330 start_codon:yes stop_codon:yes gene_type:complete
MKILNLTPHTVNLILSNSQELRFERESLMARVATTEEVVDVLSAAPGIQIPLIQVVYGEVENLPEMEMNTYLIVSRMVKAASNGRADLLIPSGLVRDVKGNIIGCKGFE